MRALDKHTLDSLRTAECTRYDLSCLCRLQRCLFFVIADVWSQKTRNDALEKQSTLDSLRTAERTRYDLRCVRRLQCFLFFVIADV